MRRLIIILSLFTLINCGGEEEPSVYIQPFNYSLSMGMGQRMKVLVSFSSPLDHHDVLTVSTGLLTPEHYAYDLPRKTEQILVVVTARGVGKETVTFSISNSEAHLGVEVQGNVQAPPQYDPPLIWCGDHICNNGEAAFTCPRDCLPQPERPLPWRPDPGFIDPKP